MKHLIWIFCLAVAFQSCDSNRIYEQYQNIPDYKWNLTDTLHFEVEISDTIHANNLYLNVRNTGAYAYSNLWLFISETAPDGSITTDKFECNLATEKGEWFGSGFGDIFDLQIPYKQQIVFPKPGIYRFDIVHGMRTVELDEIVNVGIRIEKANQ